MAGTPILTSSNYELGRQSMNNYPISKELKSDKVVDDIQSLINRLEYDKLTPKQKRFILYYRGTPTEAAKKAGYSQPTTAAFKLMQKPLVRKAIDQIDKVLEKSIIADSVEILAFWTNIIRTPGIEIKDRIIASKLLGKYRGLLSERLMLEKRDTQFVIHIQGVSDKLDRDLGENNIGSDQLELSTK